MRTIGFLLIALIHCFGTAQSDLKFIPVFGEEQIELNKRYEDQGQWTEITALRFYISDIRAYSGKKEWRSSDKYLLFDLENGSEIKIAGIPGETDSITFLIGIDSLTNVSGILDGPLDPINGMYWTWNSGYINFKLEGKSSLSLNKDKSYEFHLGGYLPPYQTVRSKTIYPGASGEWNVTIDLKEFLSGIDWSQEPNIMIPGAKASELSSELTEIFMVRP